MSKYIKVTMIYDNNSKTWGAWSGEPEWFLERIKEALTGFKPQADVTKIEVLDMEDDDADL